MERQCPLWTGTVAVSIIAGVAAGADSIDDLDVIRSGGMKKLFRGVYACATLGILLRELTHGHVRQSPTRGKHRSSSETADRKSRAGRRWLPLAAPAKAALARHRNHQDEERAFLGKDYSDHDLVFCDVAGLPLRPGGVTAAFEAHVAACGLPVVRLHDTRHGARSLLLAGSVPIEVVQMIVGHSSPAVTRKVYAHLMRKGFDWVDLAWVWQYAQFRSLWPRGLGADEGT